MMHVIMFLIIRHKRPADLGERAQTLRLFPEPVINPDAVLKATGLPAFKPDTSQYSTRLRIQRAF